MPLFFNAESHLWIGCLFIVNGLLLTWLLRSRFKSFRTLTSLFESQILSAFFISLSINGLTLLILDKLSLEFSLARWPLILIGVTFACCLYVFVVRLKQYDAFRFDLSFARLALYAFVFVVLFYNGALIEQVADSWWHMSLSNKIALESTYSPTLGHLTGLPTRYYPPLWHGNLALANKLSGVSVSVYWNSLTAWAGMFKVMAFYLFAYGISRNKRLALIAAILFVLLPGIGASYLRVSAWPSHIAYIAWYAMFYVFALLLDDLPDQKESFKKSIALLLSVSLSKLIVLIALCLVIFFTHQAEILWFAVAWLSYLIAASLSRTLSSQHEYIVERDHRILAYSYRVMLLALAAYSVWFCANQSYPIKGLSDQLLANLLPVILMLILLVIDFQVKSKVFLYGLLLAFFVLIFGSVNYLHLYSLFVPELALPKGRFHESSAIAIGYLGGELNVPSWNLQLRGGLLYSGVLSVAVAVIALVLKPSRISILMAGTGCVVLLFCSSPYLYHWLQGILNYHSPWRISLVLFHPIVWASTLLTLVKYFKVSDKAKP